MMGGSEMRVAGGMENQPDGSVVEDCHQALARIDSNLSRSLMAIAALSAPVADGMDNVHWQASKGTMEAEAKKDAEMERLQHKTVIQLYEQPKIYENLGHDVNTVSETAKSNTILPEEPKSPSEDAEKKIAAALDKVSPENTPTVLHELSSTLVKLDLSNNNLETLPEAVTSLVNLISLDLHSNQMTSLPDTIGCLVKLKVLNVSGNWLAAIPEGIADCRAMEELIADFNQLKRLPEGLGFELVNLRRLSVNSNRLTRLPYSISHMTRLRVLDVHLNCLGSLPADLENLTNLETLNLSKNFNYFVSLPEWTGGLTSLVELDISYNHIKVLPYSIARLERLQDLKVEGNPLVVPPPHIVEQSVTAIKTYMGERFKMNGIAKNGPTSSWLGRVASGKWTMRRMSNEIKNDSEVVSLPEERFSSACGNVLSPLRIFSWGRSSSPFRVFATPLRNEEAI